MIIEYRILVANPEGRDYLGDLYMYGENTIKMDLKKKVV
jgi:hypothetical protein